MNNLEIISLVVTIICLLSFCSVFTVLFKHYYDSLITRVKEGKEDIQIAEYAKEISKQEKSKKKRILKITGKVISYVFFGIIIAFFGVSLYSRFSNNPISIGNNSLVVIASGSMSEKNESNTYLQNIDNQFNTYDIIGITNYESQNDVHLYDVVAFKNKEGTIIVHRIIEIINYDNTEVYITRGDSNNTSDNGVQYEDYLRYENILGYYNGTRIQSVGIFIVFLQSNAGIITIVAIAYCLFMFDYFSNLYEKAISERKDLLINSLNLNLDDNNESLSCMDIETLLYKDKKISLIEGKYLYKQDEVNNEDLINFAEYNDFIISKEKINNSKDFNESNYFQKIFYKLKEKFSESKNKENK